LAPTRARREDLTALALNQVAERWQAMNYWIPTAIALSYRVLVRLEGTYRACDNTVSYKAE
jgi:hypothetical protein